MRGQPLGVVIATGSLVLLAIGAIAFGLYLGAVGRIAGSQTIMSPFGAALVFISFGILGLIIAVALWLGERWAWSIALALALGGLAISIIGILLAKPLPLALLVGIVLTAAVAIALMPRRVRARYRD